MTDEQLEELSYIERLILADVGERTGFDGSYADSRWEEYDSLARRVIAAEKLCKAAEKVANMDDATRAFDAAMVELVNRTTAYREASK